MSDQQIADILTFVRNNWGNSAPPVAPDEVGKLRAKLGAGEKLKTPAQ